MNPSQFDFYTQPEFYYFLIPVIITIVLYKRSKSIKDERNHLILTFKMTQNASKRIQEKIKDGIANWHLGSVKFREYNSMTYQDYYIILKNDYEKSLSDDKLEFLNNKDLTKPTILSMTESLNKQYEELVKVETDLDFLISSIKELW